MVIELLDGKIDCEKIPKEMILPALFSQFDSRYQTAANQHMAELNWRQLFFLRVVSNYQGAPSIQEVANLLGCSHQNANALMKKLVSGEYLAAVHDVCDRRCVRLTVTQKGHAFLEKQQTVAEETMRLLFQDVSTREIETVIAVMNKLHKRLSEIES